MAQPARSFPRTGTPLTVRTAVSFVVQGLLGLTLGWAIVVVPLQHWSVATVAGSVVVVVVLVAVGLRWPRMRVFAGAALLMTAMQTLFWVAWVVVMSGY